MPFKSKTEAYTYALHELLQLDEKVRNSDAVKQAIEHIKAALDNHLQDPNEVNKHLNIVIKNAPDLNDTQLKRFQNLIYLINSSPYSFQTAESKLENILGRRLESELPIILLTQPSDAMMQAVNLISKEIIKTIEQTQKQGTFNAQDILDYEFKNLLAENSSVISLGSTLQAPNLSQVIKLLQSNAPQQLPEILHIHFKFALGVMRRIALDPPRHPPTGYFATIMKEQLGMDYKSFCECVAREDEKSYDSRAHISDKLFCGSPLYLAERGKGRKGDFHESEIYRTNQLGLMRVEQKAETVNFPKVGSTWIPDCRGQEANLLSRTVRDLINNDAVYISGPSGMTSLLLGQMENMGNFENETFKQHYLEAVVAYIVGGGFHSLHEVIGPAQYALKLVPGYNVQVPDVKQDKLGPPPNYSEFYSLMTKIDPDFANKRDRAWQNYMNYFAQRYAPHYLPNINVELNKLPEEIKEVKVPPLTEIKIERKVDEPAEVKKIAWLNYLNSAMTTYLQKKKKQDVGYLRAQTIKTCIEMLEKQLLDNPSQSEDIKLKALTLISAILKRETLQPGIKRLFKERGELANSVIEQLSMEKIFFKGKKSSEKIIAANEYFERKLEKIDLRDDVVKILQSMKAKDTLQQSVNKIMSILEPKKLTIEVKLS